MSGFSSTLNFTRSADRAELVLTTLRKTVIQQKRLGGSIDPENKKRAPRRKGLRKYVSFQGLGEHKSVPPSEESSGINIKGL